MNFVYQRALFSIGLFSNVITSMSQVGALVGLDAWGRYRAVSDLRGTQQQILPYLPLDSPPKLAVLDNSPSRAQSEKVAARLKEFQRKKRTGFNISCNHCREPIHRPISTVSTAESVIEVTGICAKSALILAQTVITS